MAGTIFFLERGIVEPVQFLAYCRVHRMDVKKLPVPQTGNDMGSQISNTPLYGCFIMRGQYPGGNQRGVIVIRQLLVRAVYNRGFVFFVAEDSNL